MLSYLICVNLRQSVSNQVCRTHTWKTLNSKINSEILSVLIEPQTGFQIAFNMFDTDGNQRVDKNEFLVVMYSLCIYSLVNHFMSLNSFSTFVDRSYLTLNLCPLTLPLKYYLNFTSWPICSMIGLWLKSSFNKMLG